MLIEKAVSKLSENNIAVSKWTKDRLEGLGVPGEKIAFIPNGIDLKRISEIEPNWEKFSVGPENKLMILFLQAGL